MESRERELIDAMQRDPRDEGAKQRYEELLAEIRPDALERQILQRQRELAEAYKDQAAFDRLIGEYHTFRIDDRAADYFWDFRGSLAWIVRTFDVWLVSFNQTRRFAVEQALQIILNKSVDLDFLPVCLVDSMAPEIAHSMKEKILDFIRRYKGPTGREGDVQPDEIVLMVTPFWIDDPTQ